MATTRTMKFEKNLSNRTLNIERSFAGSLERVWQAWTDSSILDQWWAPKPYRAETKAQDFRVGGMWLYCMVGPEGDRQWCRADYTSITPMKNYESTDGFCDESGNDTVDFPKMHWHNDFMGDANQTTVKITVSFDTQEGLEKYLESGFREGFEAGMQNLDGVLAQG